MAKINQRTRKPMPKTKRRSLKIGMTDRQWNDLQRRAAEIGIPVTRLIGMLTIKWLEGEITMEV